MRRTELRKKVVHHLLAEPGATAGGDVDTTFGGGGGIAEITDFGPTFTREFNGALIAVGVFFPVYLGVMGAVISVDRKIVEVGRTVAAPACAAPAAGGLRAEARRADWIFFPGGAAVPGAPAPLMDGRL